MQDQRLEGSSHIVDHGQWEILGLFERERVHGVNMIAVHAPVSLNQEVLLFLLDEDAAFRASVFQDNLNHFFQQARQFQLPARGSAWF